MWGHLSVQIFHRCSVYQANCGDLIFCFQLHMRGLFLFSHIAPDHIVLVLYSHLPLYAALLHLFPAQTGGGESIGWACSLSLGRGRDVWGVPPTVGMCKEFLQQQRLERKLLQPEATVHFPRRVGPWLQTCARLHRFPGSHGQWPSLIAWWQW